MAKTAADFQQAETPTADDRFLQIVANVAKAAEGAQAVTDAPAAVRAPGVQQQHKLSRVTFRVSRLTEFCSLKELQAQTGHQILDWPLVVIKELMDNALDACEEAELAPSIAIAVSPGAITVRDNGTGIPETTIRSILDYTVRVSSREAYVSPSRGAQGNALKTILAMGYVIDREGADYAARQTDGNPCPGNADAFGLTIIETRGIAHRIEFRVDHVTNEPRISYTTTSSQVTAGTRITVRWPDIQGYVSLLDMARDRFKRFATDYTWLNPHLTLRGTWNGEEFVNVQASDPTWSKWRPRDPTSAHWYTPERLQRYMSAHVARDRELRIDRPVREFIGEFRGLSGTAKQRRILAELGVSHRSLSYFFGRDKVNLDGISRLGAAMQRHSEPVNPKHLGIIGREHLKTCILGAGAAANTFRYACRKGTSPQGIPYVIESAFGLHQSGLDGGRVARRIVAGANWSIGINNPFRTFGSAGEGLENKLAEVRANATNPVIICLHLASAHLQYADRGKSSIITTGTVDEADDV